MFTGITYSFILHLSLRRVFVGFVSFYLTCCYCKMCNILVGCKNVFQEKRTWMYSHNIVLRTRSVLTKTVQTFIN